MNFLYSLFKNLTTQKIFITLSVIIGTIILFYVDPKIQVFIVMSFAIYFFVNEKFPSEITALLTMIILIILGLVSPEEGVSGFSNSAAITVLAIFVISAGIQRTGIIHKLSRVIFRFAGNSEVRQLLLIALLVGPISGFLNNTAVVAMLLPMVIDIAKRSGTSATKLLIPLSFFSMAGGMTTLLGTSTSILANSILSQYPNFKPLNIFEFTNLGLIVLGITVLYFLIIGRFLLPKKDGKEKNKETDIESRFLTEIEIQADSILIGQTLKSSKFLEKNDLEAIKIIRDEQNFSENLLEEVIKEKDIIILFGDEQRIIDLDKNEKDGVKILLNFNPNRNMPITAGRIFKVLTKTPMFLNLPKAKVNSWMEFGNTFFGKIFKNRDEVSDNFYEDLRKNKLYKNYNASIVGVNCEKITSKRLANTRVETGEILLLKATKKGYNQIKRSDNFVILEVLEEEFNPEKMWIALLITIGVVLLAAFGIFPIMVSALIGMVLMILTKCLNAEDLQSAISWDVIFLLAGIIPLGIAMEKSGAAKLVADSIVSASGFLSPIMILGLFYLITTLLTTVISNNASVILLIPVALSVADNLGLNSMAFVLAVMFASSISFLSPVGYQTNTMVFGAGNYKFFDFFRVGAPLNIILGLVITILITKFWGL